MSNKCSTNADTCPLSRGCRGLTPGGKHSGRTRHWSSNPPPRRTRVTFSAASRFSRPSPASYGYLKSGVARSFPTGSASTPTRYRPDRGCPLGWHRAGRRRPEWGDRSCCRNCSVDGSARSFPHGNLLSPRPPRGALPLGLGGQSSPRPSGSRPAASYQLTPTTGRFGNWTLLLPVVRRLAGAQAAGRPVAAIGVAAAFQEALGTR